MVDMTGERVAEVEGFHNIKEAARHCCWSTQQVSLSTPSWLL